VGVGCNRSDGDAERNRAGNNNEEVRESQRVRRWKDRGVMTLQRVFPAKLVVGIKSCLAASENFAGGGGDNIPFHSSATKDYSLYGLHPSYHPRGVPIFPVRRREVRTKEIKRKQ